jgi:recombinational DNA repair ATPase RecF
MRLKSVHIDQFKNLKIFKLNFNGSSFIDVFVGKNGAGKSNTILPKVYIFSKEHHLMERRPISARIAVA